VTLFNEAVSLVGVELHGNITWIMRRSGFGRKWSWHFWGYISEICRKPLETSAGFPANIWTGRSLYTRCHWANLLRWTIRWIQYMSQSHYLILGCVLYHFGPHTSCICSNASVCRKQWSERAAVAQDKNITIYTWKQNNTFQITAFCTYVRRLRSQTEHNVSETGRIRLCPQAKR
jgi:hypothetical protein